MRVILHVGMSKAGSTAIQNALLANEAQLAQNGVIYPSVGRYRGAHYPILQAARSMTAELLTSRALSEARRKSGSTCILSCEGFWLLGSEQIDVLAEMLKGHEVQVLAYLRDPASYLRSSYRQGIKAKGRKESVAQRVARAGPQLAYSAVFGRWASNFPLTLASYELNSSRLESHFMSLIGVAEYLQPPAPVRANVTPPDGVTRAMLWANRMLPFAVARGARRLIQRNAKSFSWLPKMDDSAFQVAGNGAKQQWDTEFLARHMTAVDLKYLTNGAGVGDTVSESGAV